MRYWSLLVPAECYERERLFAADRLDLPVPGATAGDTVVLVADLATPVIFGWGRVTGTGAVLYERRLLDAPLVAARLLGAGPAPGELAPGELAPAGFDRIRAAVGSPPRRRAWLVSVDLPVEAGTPGEAVRQFWSYLNDLGPRELPAFVTPLGDELAMQAYVLGEQTNLDPEEE